MQQTGKRLWHTGIKTSTSNKSLTSNDATTLAEPAAAPDFPEGPATAADMVAEQAAAVEVVAEPMTVATYCEEGSASRSYFGKHVSLL